MLPVLNILFYSLVLLLLSALLLIYKKIKLFEFEWGALAGGAIILTAWSFFIFKEKVGGTIIYRSHGWPHFFMNYQVKDILDNAIIDKWHFVPGGLGSYLIADFIFYFSALWFLLILFKTIKK